ncbi:23S ribosomal RNA methyltransferase Erm [Staphylococcus chromogenes]|nr:23S ribosomal RNA methyltransferase Erm [Staphylococcus chromogenes]
MSAYGHGRHEHGQNFLIDTTIVNVCVQHVARTSGPIVEIGPGSGALTFPMSRLGRPIIAVEIDAAMVKTLNRAKSGGSIDILHADFLSYQLPTYPHVVAGNIPFSLTTAILRKLLRAPGWTDAVLLMQWEVARRRAGVGGVTMMTAQWAPWFTFELGERVPRSAFKPRPNVDGGILLISRVDEPEVSVKDQKAFQAMVHSVFTGKGRGLAEILVRARLFESKTLARRGLESRGISASALPPNLSRIDWVDLFNRREQEPSRTSRGVSKRRRRG